MDELLRSGWQSNPAMKMLVDEYAKFHTVFVVATSIAVLVLISMSVLFWVRSRKVLKPGTLGARFEKRLFRSFALLGSLVSLILTLLIIANTTNAFTSSNALPGFSSLVSTSTMRGDSAASLALIGWIESKNDQPPLLIRQMINDRISWQAPKAIICGVLLILFTALSAWLWSSLLQQKRKPKPNGRFKKNILFVTGTTTVTLALLMLIMFLANMQGAIAPLTITILPDRP